MKMLVLDDCLGHPFVSIFLFSLAFIGLLWSMVSGPDKKSIA